MGLYFDNTPGNGDVRMPDSVDVGGVNYDLIPDAQYGPRWVYFNIPTAPISIRLPHEAPEPTEMPSLERKTGSV